jgi:hypothetical protein
MKATVASGEELTDARFIRPLDADFVRMSNLMERNQLSTANATGPAPVLCTGRTTQAEECLGLFGRPVW